MRRLLAVLSAVASVAPLCTSLVAGPTASPNRRHQPPPRRCRRRRDRSAGDDRGPTTAGVDARVDDDGDVDDGRADRDDTHRSSNRWRHHATTTTTTTSAHTARPDSDDGAPSTAADDPTAPPTTRAGPAGRRDRPGPPSASRSGAVGTRRGAGRRRRRRPPASDHVPGRRTGDLRQRLRSLSRRLPPAHGATTSSVTGCSRCWRCTTVSSTTSSTIRPPGTASSSATTRAGSTASTTSTTTRPAATTGTTTAPGGSPTASFPARTVRAGQQIGWMGDSGNSEGSVPHAHVEIIAARRGGDEPVLEPAPRPARRELSSRGDRAVTVSGGRTRLARHRLGHRPAPRWVAAARRHRRPSPSGAVAARMWVNPLGYTPVDAAALRVGDARYDRPLDCTGQEAAGVAAAVPHRTGDDPRRDPGDRVRRRLQAPPPARRPRQAPTSSSTAAGAATADTGGRGTPRRPCRTPRPPNWRPRSSPATVVTSPPCRCRGTSVTSPSATSGTRVPAYPGNSLTPRQYLERWMGKYAELLGRPDAGSIGLASWTPIDVERACHTVVVDVGEPGAPRFALTQAQQFAADSSGRAVPAADDPCDPGARRNPPPSLRRRCPNAHASAAIDPGEPSAATDNRVSNQ